MADDQGSIMAAFIKPDQPDPWIKGQIKITLLSAISSLQLSNFMLCGRALVTVGGKIVDSRAFPIWSLIHGSSWSGLIKVGPVGVRSQVNIKYGIKLVPMDYLVTGVGKVYSSQMRSTIFFANYVTLNSQKTPGISTSQVSYAGIASILENIDLVIMAPYCIMINNLTLAGRPYVHLYSLHLNTNMHGLV